MSQVKNSNVPPIPLSPIGENQEWRDWTSRIANVLQTTPVINTTATNGSNTATINNAPISGDPSKWCSIVDGDGITRYFPVW